MTDDLRWPGVPDDFFLASMISFWHFPPQTVHHQFPLRVRKVAGPVKGRESAPLPSKALISSPSSPSSPKVTTGSPISPIAPERVPFGSYRGSCQVSIRGVVVGAGVGGQGGDDAGCGRGDGCPDGGLLDGGAVEDLDVERG